MSLLVQNKEVVAPGEVLAEGMDFLPSKGTYRSNDKIIAKRLGLIRVDGKVIKLIPLSGTYVPKKNDVIICQVFDILMHGWRVETNCAYSAVLPLSDGTTDFVEKGADLTQYFDLGDFIVTKVTKVTTQKLIDISMKGPGLRKLVGGRTIKVNPYKVPRIIGKAGSMVQLIKQATDTQVVVGQNGIVWVNGKDPKKEVIAVKTIEKIVANAHVAGLTDIIKKDLGLEGQAPVESKPAAAKPAESKPFVPKPVEQKPVEQKPVEQKPVEQKPAAPQPVEPKPAPKPAPTTTGEAK